MPFSPNSLIYSHINKLDIILFLTNNINYSGEISINKILPKIRRIRKILNDKNLDLDISVDGGMSVETIPLVAAAGANVIIAGDAIFGKPDYKTAISKLRNCIKNNYYVKNFFK
jgi:ribulose-phosphate 3-epimerase